MASSSALSFVVAYTVFLPVTAEVTSNQQRILSIRITESSVYFVMYGDPGTCLLNGI
jgi:hypothetical protein